MGVLIFITRKRGCGKAMFTVRNSSCGKVMFSQVSVCPRGGRCTPPRQTPPWVDTTPGRHPPKQLVQQMVRILLQCILVSQASVCSQWKRGIGTSQASNDRCGLRPSPQNQTWRPTLPLPSLPSPPCYWHLVVITGDRLKFVHLKTYCSQYWHLVVATKNTYSWQVGSTHPTGVLSCFNTALTLTDSKHWARKHSSRIPTTCLPTIWSVLLVWGYSTDRSKLNKFEHVQEEGVPVKWDPSWTSLNMSTFEHSLYYEAQCVIYTPQWTCI